MGVLVLHALGEPEGGAPWSDALSGPALAVTAPDLPGHGQAPTSIDGSYTTGLILLTAARCLGTEDSSALPVVVGVGASGWVALVLALAGRASAVAVVDGLGGPWRSAAEATADGVAWARRLIDDPHRLGPVPAGVADPRLEQLPPPFSNESIARQAVGALRVPLLVASGPADPLTAEERTRLLAHARVPVTTVTVRSARPDDVAPAIGGWISMLGRAGPSVSPTARRGEAGRVG
jgi:pimeloyl-ACP methyl ester carboxylesterase